MAKFYGAIGYGEPVETAPGVVMDHIVEYHYYGDVVRNTTRFENGDKVNNDLATSNSISVLADAYANEHFSAIRYVEWAGTLWNVTTVELQRPRLLLGLGGVYNGPRPEA